MSTSSNDNQPAPRPRTSRRRTTPHHHQLHHHRPRDTIPPEIRAREYTMPVDVEIPNKQEEDKTRKPRSNSGALALQPAKLTRTTAKQMILQAVDLLETENEELKKINHEMLNQINQLTSENETLKRDLDTAISECKDAKSVAETIERENSSLRNEFLSQSKRLQEENSVKDQQYSKLKSEIGSYQTTIEDLREDIDNKEKDLKNVTREVNMLRHRLENNSRRNFNDRDIELMHELEVLKDGQKDLAVDKDELEKMKRKLLCEIKGLEGQLSDKTSELKNENRRHSLLTKEFNSLLEENNHLKLQLRKRQGHVTRVATDDQSSESVTEIKVAPLQRNQTSLNRPPTTHPARSKSFVSAANQAFPSARDVPKPMTSQSRGDTTSDSNSRSSPESLPYLSSSSKTWRP